MGALCGKTGETQLATLSGGLPHSSLHNARIAAITEAAGMFPLHWLPDNNSLHYNVMYNVYILLYMNITTVCIIIYIDNMLQVLSCCM